MSEAVDITAAKDGGLLKEILKEGEGEIRPPNGVETIVHYVGKLLDGTVFDSSRDRNEPFIFKLGRGNVIKGWDVGVATMKKGEKSILTCRSDYAYGKTGSPPKIPPDATLQFEVELLDWKPENLSGKNDNGILRHPITIGTGIDSPKDGANVEVTLLGELEGKVFFDKRLSFCLGEGVKIDVPRGVELALEKMVVNEVSRLELKPAYAWGSKGSPSLQVPPNSTVFYTVTLHNFEIVKNTWMMTPQEKITRGNELKEKGTKYLKEGDFELALKMYTKLVELMDYNGEYEEEEDKERKSLLLAGYLNLSMTHLKKESMVNCREMCTKALEIDPKSVKALFRRGQALLGMNEPNLAKDDFKKVLEIEPTNKAAVNQLTICQKKAAEIKQNEKKIYANMFDKFARKDKEKEEEKARKENDVLAKVGEWGISERGHHPTDFEKENPNILMLDKDGDFKDM